MSLKKQVAWTKCSKTHGCSFQISICFPKHYDFFGFIGVNTRNIPVHGTVHMFQAHKMQSEGNQALWKAQKNEAYPLCRHSAPSHHLPRAEQRREGAEILKETA